MIWKRPLSSSQRPRTARPEYPCPAVRQTPDSLSGLLKKKRIIRKKKKEWQRSVKVVFRFPIWSRLPRPYPCGVEERGEEVDDPGTPRLRQKAVNGFKREAPEKVGREDYKFDRDSQRTTDADLAFLAKKHGISDKEFVTLPA
jgi:hypothetical protein